jgi:cytochrome c oxidase cbb3-type subunit 2
MTVVSLNIHGKNYGVSCDPGQENRVSEVGQYVDARARDIASRMRVLRTMGVPYTEEMIASARADLAAQARPDVDAAGFQSRYARARQAAFDGDPNRITEMDALVAYLQMLGTLVQFRDVTPEQLRQQ